MATLEFIHHRQVRCHVQAGKVEWLEAPGRNPIDRLPQIVWCDQSPWREANLWALKRAVAKTTSLKTVTSSMSHLHAYAKWLEQEDMSWSHFPAREDDRCLVRFRGALIDAMQSGVIAPSTASQRMAAVVRFYRWLQANKLLSSDWPLWRERQIGVRIGTHFGLERTLMATTTDLAIPNRKRHGEMLEDGLLPVSIDVRNKILELAQYKASTELGLMLRLGFRTGMRLGTIADLKLGTLTRAVPDPLLRGWFRLAVGPGAHPSVHTKFGVTGQIYISEADLEELRDYYFCTRRLKRQALAATKDKQLVFLTRYGAPYFRSDAETSRAINVEMGRLRRAGLASGFEAVREFHFHQSRCTFATELARLLMKHGNVSIAVQTVKEALLHKDEATTLKYIKFIERSAAMSEAADEFTQQFLDLASRTTSDAKPPAS